jgi:hypothetical protein
MHVNSTHVPFVYRFGNARVLSGSPYIEFLPLVTDDTRADWEAYVKEHRGQYLDAYQTDHAIRKHQDVQFGRDDESGQGTAPQLTIADNVPPQSDGDGIWNIGRDGIGLVAPPRSGPYLPVWTFSPTIYPFSTRMHWRTPFS